MQTEFICTYHDKIKDLAKILKKNEDPKIKQTGIEIYELIKKAKDAGIQMEKRLLVYRRGIEEMGFERKKE